jgi:membrane protease YdiL (CAAX protease family)
MEAGAEPAYALAVFGMIALATIGTVRSGMALQRYTPTGSLLLGLPDNVLRLFAVITCFIIGATLGPGPEALGWGTDRIWRDLIIGAVAGVILALCVSLGARLVVRIWGPQAISTHMVRCILPADRHEWILVPAAMLSAVLLEELLFRSLPLGGLAWLVSPWLLLWPLSLLFGLLHWPQGGWGIAGATLIGVALSFLFLATGSLWAAFSAHYVLNMHQLTAAQRAGLSPLRAKQSVGVDTPMLPR